MTHPIPRLAASDAASYRDIRLDGLRRHPEAFGASWTDEADRPLNWFARRLEDNVVFGGWAAGTLAGVAGLMTPAVAKMRHKGVLWGMYVRPGARGTGLAAALVQRVIGHAGSVAEEILLTVTASNPAAAKLYARFGFQQYGFEPRALKIEDRYHDLMLMRLPLGGPG